MKHHVPMPHEKVMPQKQDVTVLDEEHLMMWTYHEELKLTFHMTAPKNTMGDEVMNKETMDASSEGLIAGNNSGSIPNLENVENALEIVDDNVVDALVQLDVSVEKVVSKRKKKKKKDKKKELLVVGEDVPIKDDNNVEELSIAERNNTHRNHREKDAAENEPLVSEREKKQT